MQAGDILSARIHNGSINLPPSDEAPMILCGMGSGLAPLRAQIQERVYHASKNKDIKMGEIALFFGTRNSKNEWFYKDEFESYHNNGKGPLTHILPAFSRDGKEKYYIQNRFILNKNKKNAKKNICVMSILVFLCLCFDFILRMIVLLDFFKKNFVFFVRILSTLYQFVRPQNKETKENKNTKQMKTIKPKMYD